MASPPVPCAVADCDRNGREYFNGAKLCSLHVKRARRHGDPLVSKKRMPGPCEVTGCGERARRWGYCASHSEQFRTWGDPLMRTTKAPDGAGSIRKDGYKALTLHGHPLADRWGHVLEHRVVLYAKIGPGDHPCHWCGSMLRWEAPGRMVRIEADHLDFDPLNNDPVNLVPSCNPCNVRRSLERRWDGPGWNPMACSGCGNTWRSRGKPGHWIACPACKVRSKVII